MMIGLCLLSLLIGLSIGQDQCLHENTLRLNPAGSFMSTIHSVSGRLEICYCPSASSSCTWSTVNLNAISTPWSWKNVQVACRQLARDRGLALSGLGNPILNSNIPLASVASDSVPIHPFVFRCDGTESNLTSCITTSVSIILRFHLLDVFITCLTTASEALLSNSIRLTGSTTSHAGVIELYRRNRQQWETVCADGSFGTEEATAVCLTLGYNGGRVLIVQSTQFRGNQINSSPLTSIECSTGVADISSCLIREVTRCASNQLAAVICSPNSSSEGTVRLVPITTSSTWQRVEVLYAGRWGSVCNTNWNSSDGQVVCRNLGQGIDNVRIPDSFSSTLSQRPVWTSGYNCRGSETNLRSCSISYPTGYAPNCIHTNDAVLSCNSATDSGSGLSAGAIVGIVFSIFFVIFIVIPIIYAYSRQYWEKGEMRGWWRRQTHRVRAWTQRNFELEERQDETINEPTHNETGYLSSELTTSTSPPPPPLENPEYTKPAPPSYDDAINLHQHQQQLPPPDYYPPATDPAYPPVAPITNDPAYPPSVNSNAYPVAPITDPVYPPTINSEVAYPPSTTTATSPPAYSIPINSDLAYPPIVTSDPAYPTTNTDIGLTNDTNIDPSIVTNDDSLMTNLSTNTSSPNHPPSFPVTTIQSEPLPLDEGHSTGLTSEQGEPTRDQ